MQDDPVKVLIVDDDEVDRELIRRHLSASFVVEEAATASEGLERIGAVAPACVILDYLLPDASGLEALGRIASAHSDTAVVMLTGQGDEAVAVSAIRGGAQDYRVKDDLGGLTDAVRSAIRRKAVEQALHLQREEAAHPGPARTAFWVTSADGRFVEYVSPGFETLWGRPVQQLYDDPDAWLAAVEGDRRDVGSAFSAPHRVEEREYEIRTPAGEARAVADRTVPIRDERDRLHRILRFATEVTSERELEKRLMDALGTTGSTPGSSVVAEVTLADLQAGMVLIEDVMAKNGLRLVSRGQEVTATLRTRLRNFSQSIGVVEPLHVLTARGSGLSSRDAARAYHRT
jgi:ActR/RegA family two-component response regulator